MAKTNKNKKVSNKKAQILGPYRKVEIINKKDFRRLKDVFMKEKVDNNLSVKIPTEKVFPYVSDYIYRHGSQKLEKEIDGWKFTVTKEGEFIGGDFGFGFIAKISSERLTTFKKSSECVCCGIQGAYFKKTPNSIKNPTSYHLNMYAVDGDREILMTKDHIIPRSKGGANELENYVTCCEVCNNLKNSSLESWDELRERFAKDPIKVKNGSTNEDISLMKNRIAKYKKKLAQ